MKKILMILLGTIISFSCFSNNMYKELDTEEIKSKKIVIQEFFFYGCPHCYRLESNIDKWINDLDKSKFEIQQIPVDYGEISIKAAKHHYAAETFGKLNEFKKIYFEKIIKDKKEISDELAIEILVSLGEKEEKAKESINSFLVEKKVKKAKELTRKYKINAVPSFVINGKYYTDAELSKGEKNIFNVLNSLIK